LFKWLWTLFSTKPLNAAFFAMHIISILRFFADFPPFFVVFGPLRFLKMVAVGTLFETYSSYLEHEMGADLVYLLRPSCFTSKSVQDILKLLTVHVYLHLGGAQRVHFSISHGGEERQSLVRERVRMGRVWWNSLKCTLSRQSGWSCLALLGTGNRNVL
jgi:hypothetical protein